MSLLSSTIKDIKSLKIQGAESIAEKGLLAWESAKNKESATKQLLASRPTEPMLKNVLFLANNGISVKKIEKKLIKDKQKIYKLGSKLIRNKSTVFVHCHSSIVAGILKEAKNNGKNFKVNNTETRPFYQGRITSRELSDYGIQVEHYTDSSAMLAMQKADLFLFGSDAIIIKGSYNKIGSNMFSEIARRCFNIPIYSCTHSWKITDKVTVEHLSRKDIWPEAPKNVKINNPAFELVDSKNITGVVSEIGIFSIKEFVKKASEELRRMK